MPRPVKVGMPQEVTIGATYTLQVAALDQSTGSDVAGVNISNMTIEVENLSGGDLSTGLFTTILIPVRTK